MGHVETELDRRSNLIHILPTRTGGVDEFLMNLFLIDRDGASNLNHW